MFNFVQKRRNNQTYLHFIFGDSISNDLFFAPELTRTILFIGICKALSQYHNFVLEKKHILIERKTFN